LFGNSLEPICFMLRGVSAGIMELVFEKGTYEGRIDLYKMTESSCTCTCTCSGSGSGSEKCHIHIERR
jgi:hypothetical protein